MNGKIIIPVLFISSIAGAFPYSPGSKGATSDVSNGSSILVGGTASAVIVTDSGKAITTDPDFLFNGTTATVTALDIGGLGGGFNTDSMGIGAGYYLQKGAAQGVQFNLNTILGPAFNLQLSAGSEVNLDDGAIGTPALSFLSETGLGLYRASDGNLAVVDGGAAIINFNSSSISSGVETTLTASATDVSIFNLKATATNDDPIETVRLLRDTTTDGVAKTIWTFDLVADTSYLFEANVLGRRTGGTAGAAGDSAGYKVFGTLVDVAGTATPVGAGTTTAITLEDQAGWNAAFAVSSGNVLLQVTGATDNNVVWHVIIRIMKVAS